MDNYSLIILHTDNYSLTFFYVNLFYLLPIWWEYYHLQKGKKVHKRNTEKFYPWVKKI